MLTRIRQLSVNPEIAALLGTMRGSQASGRRGRAVVWEDHVQASYQWLCAAQDASGGGGVAGCFELLAGRWSPPYPETTGYIIPTFLALSKARSDPQARERALRMADWEIELQMEDGAVLSGLLGTPRGPAVFNTGQALFGWTAAFKTSGDTRYAEAARAAAEWLLRHQDDDGAWRRNLSMVTSAPVHSYNNRCAWALAYAASVLDEERFMRAAVHNSDWVLAQQNEAGWFGHAGFKVEDVPLLHTISYVIEGLLGVYAFSGDPRYLQAAKRAVDQIVARHGLESIPGRLDGDWNGTVSWRCVTGDAQIALVLLRLEALCPGNGYRQMARRMIQDLAEIQLRLTGGAEDSTSLRSARSPVAGGLPGSFPVWGSYMRFALPNWAAKFYLDALLLEVYGVDEDPFDAALRQ